MKHKSKLLLAIVLMVVFALTRIPGLLPQNFSAAYALAFCAGVYFSGPVRWFLPLLTLLATDVILNLYYWKKMNSDLFSPALLWYLLGNYLAYGSIIRLGQAFGPKSKFLGLLGGGFLGALLFYLITNTASWLINPFQNPEYTRNFQGWIIALTKGTAGWPETWQFFQNTLLSGGLFTAAFVAVAKIEEASREEKAEEEGSEQESPAEKEAKA